MRDDWLKVGDRIEVTTERMAYGGDAIARYHGLTVFVPLAAPGERLRVRITEHKKNFARAAIEEVIVASPSRRKPPCQYFGDCGGCQLQHLTYEAQLDAKVDFIRDALKRIGHIDWPHEIKIRHGKELGYRARAQIKLEPINRGKADKPRTIGFHRAGSHSVCDVASCPILVPELDAALRSLRSSVNQSSFSISDASRLADLTEIEMAAGESGVAFEPELPSLTSSTLQRTVRGTVYSFDTSTFFQVNALLLEALVDEAVADQSGRLAIDLYAGAGLFTVQLARRFDRVIAVESDRRAAGFARENIRANSISNVEFHNTRTERWLKDYIAGTAAQDAPVDLVLLDPPRAGAAEAVSRIAMLRPARITYVSCDPATLARDLRKLLDSGCEVANIVAIDLFPQTFHIETVASLRHR